MLKDAWALAIETLNQIELRKLSERLALTQSSRRLGITDSNSIRYAYGLIVETERYRNVIDKFINNTVKPKTLKEFSVNIQAFLRLYVYQTRIAKDGEQPSLEEAVRIANLVRAVIGWRTIRPVEPFLGLLLTRQIKGVMRESTDEERIALQTLHPTWFVKYCFRLFGRNEAISFLQKNIHPPPTFLRLNTLKATQEEIIAKLNTEGVELERIEALNYVYKVIDSKRSLSSLTSYDKGLFYIQDKASCFAVQAANPKSNMTILDVCAAPGSKTTFLAQLMHNKGVIYSLDYSARRMRTWKQETKWFGTSIAEPIIADVRSNLPINAQGDIVILDPPCTSTGSFGRQPSAKWRLTPKSVETMIEIQWLMINNCAESVKPHGFLIYTTCSIMVEENEMIIERFLKWYPEFHLTEITLQLGSQGLRGLKQCRRFYPHLHESNGAFIAKLKKD
ncbi:MAG: RsmB/NOP family class I SAM-dependent RNA methyltransferase [Chloroflexota bacterium]